MNDSVTIVLIVQLTLYLINIKLGGVLSHIDCLFSVYIYDHPTVVARHEFTM